MVYNRAFAILGGDAESKSLQGVVFCLFYCRFLFIIPCNPYLTIAAMTDRTFARPLKVLLIVVGFFAVMSMAVFWGLPALLTHQLPKLIGQQLDRKASLAAAAVHLSPLALELRGLVIEDAPHHNKDTLHHNGDNHALFAFAELYVAVDAWQSLKQGALVISQASLKEPVFHLVRTEKGTLNLPELPSKAPEAKPKATDKLFPVSVAKLSVSDGQLVWHDAKAPKPWSETLQALTLTVDGFSTYTGQAAPIDLRFGLQSGGHLHWHGTFDMATLASQGELSIDKPKLSKFAALFVADCGADDDGNHRLAADYQASYDKGKLMLKVSKSLLELHGLYCKQAGGVFKIAAIKHEMALTLAYEAGELQLEAKAAKLQADGVSVQGPLSGTLKQLKAETTWQMAAGGKHGATPSLSQGSLQLKELRLVGHDSQTNQDSQLVFLPLLSLQGLQANFDKHLLKAKSFAINNADIKVWLNPDGSLNFQTLAAASPQKPATTQSSLSSTPSPASTQASASWRVDVASVSVNNGAVNFTDRSLPHPADVKLAPINFQLDGFSNKAASSPNLPFSLAIGVNSTGSIGLKGDLGLNPFKIEAELAVSGIDLANFQPYYDKFIRLDIIDGQFWLKGSLSLAQTDGSVPDIQFDGNSGINNLLIRDQRVHKDFLKWERLTLNDMAVDVVGQVYSFGELAIRKPYVRLTIRKDKTVNISNLLLAQSPAAALAPSAKSAAKAAAKPLLFKLGKIQIIDGSSDFSDLSLLLPFTAYIKNLQGAATGLSSNKNSQIQLKLNGNAYDMAPVDIVGKISPFLGLYDIQVKFNDLPMPLVSAYMVQFVGYKIEKGKLTLDLHYQIADKNLTASNHFLIDEFELGDRVENPDAVSLPIKLAVDLLKGPDGKIKIDVPISGNLSNPNFSIGDILFKAVVNSVEKVISSPFTALALLTADHHSELSNIAFKPGDADLDKLGRAKLDTIAAALKANPKLQLNIKGYTYQAQDWPEISDDALYDQLKARRADEINRQATQKIRPEYVTLAPADYQRLLAELFIEKFPALAEKSPAGVPQLKGRQTGDFYALAKQKLQASLEPEPERLEELANNRAQAIVNYLIQQDGIAEKQVYILDSVVSQDKGGRGIVSLLSLQSD